MGNLSRISWCWVWLVSVSTLPAQPQIQDSLIQSLNSIGVDTAKVDALNNIARTFWGSNNQEALSYAERALLLAHQNSYKAGETRALNYIGIAHTNTGDYSQALIYLDSALDQAEQFNHQKLKPGILNSLAIVHRRRGFYPQAVYYLLETLKLLEDKGSPGMIAGLLLNIGNVHLDLKEYDSAISHYKRAIPLFEEVKHDRGLVQAYNNLGDVYGELDQPELALEYFDKSLALKRKAADYYGIAITNVNIGEILTRGGQFDKALVHYDSSLIYFNKASIQTEIAHAYLGKARVAFEKNRPERSLQNARKAFDLADQSDLRRVTRDASLLLSKLYERRNDHRQALSFHKKYVELKDSLFNEENLREISQLQSRFEIEKREQEIALLEAQNLRANAEVDRARAYQISISIVGLLVLVAAVYVYFTQKQKHKLRTEVMIGEISELRLQIRQLIGKYEGDVSLDIETFNNHLVNPLSDREFEIFKLIFSEKTNREIAEVSFVSVNTVKFHLKNIYDKLGVSNRKEALQFVLESSQSD